MNARHCIAVLWLPLCAAAAAPPPDAATLDFLADWPADESLPTPDTPALDDPLLAVLDALTLPEGDTHESSIQKPTQRRAQSNRR